MYFHEANMRQWQIDSRQELAVFFAHILQGTQGFECLKLKESNLKRKSGDFFGRGFLHFFGESLYEEAGNAVQYNLVQNPNILCENKLIAWQTALWFWKTYVCKKGFNATSDNFSSSTKLLFKHININIYVMDMMYEERYDLYLKIYNVLFGDGKPLAR